MNKAPEAEKTYTARCSCGGLSVTVAGQPVRINACTCLDCQRRSGSAFSYTAFFPETAIRTVTGESRVWRELRDTGRWHDSVFCPVCGVAVYSRLEAIPNTIGVAVGCLSDPGFAAPERFYWTTRRPHWLMLPEDLPTLERQ